MSFLGNRARIQTDVLLCFFVIFCKQVHGPTNHQLNPQQYIEGSTFEFKSEHLETDPAIQTQPSHIFESLVPKQPKNTMVSAVHASITHIKQIRFDSIRHNHLTLLYFEFGFELEFVYHNNSSLPLATLFSMASTIALSSNTGPCPSHFAHFFNLSLTSPTSTNPRTKSGCLII